MKKSLVLLLLFASNTIYSQSYYMHEAAEDSDGNPIGGFAAMVVVFGVIYFIEKYLKSVKQIKKAKEEKIAKYKTAKFVSDGNLLKYKDISIYQDRAAWQKGYIDATFDIQNNSIRTLNNKTIEVLIADYREKQRLGIPGIEKIMEEIGYFEHLEHNNKLLVTEGRKPFEYVVFDRFKQKTN